ncbi:MAG: DUF2007 domain-containing protein [Gemmatimonadota bacterium]
MSEPTWTQVIEYAAQYEADLAVAILAAAGIPTMLKGPGAGIFGPGMAGLSPIPVRVFVPSEALEDAREILTAEPEDEAEEP